MEDLLESILEAQKDLKEIQDAQRICKVETEARKEEIGRALISRATKRASFFGDEEEKVAGKGNRKDKRWFFGDDDGLG